MAQGCVKPVHVRREALLPVLWGLDGLVHLHTLLLLPTSMTWSERECAMHGKCGLTSLTSEVVRILPSL